MRRNKFLKYLPPMLGVFILAGVVATLHGVLKHIGLGDVLAALQAIPGKRVLRALLLLAGAFCIMLVYDIPGVLFARGLEDFPRLGWRISFASFCAYALSHVLGAPAITAAAIRVRLYAHWGASALGIARIVAISGSMFTIGLSSLLSFLLLLRPWDVPLFGHAMPEFLLRLAGAVLAGGVVFYVVGARRRSGFRLWRWNIPLPGGRVALAQVVLSCGDILVSCGILYAVLPWVHGLGYTRVLGFYLAAFAGGMISGLPGGVGVFDSLLLLELSGYLPPAAALGAIVLFRVLYYLCPAAVAALSYAGHEFYVHMRERG